MSPAWQHIKDDRKGEKNVSVKLCKKLDQKKLKLVFGWGFQNF